MQVTRAYDDILKLQLHYTQLQATSEFLLPMIKIHTSYYSYSNDRHDYSGLNR
jgi:hypothetical protein